VKPSIARRVAGSDPLKISTPNNPLPQAFKNLLSYFIGTGVALHVKYSWYGLLSRWRRRTCLIIVGRHERFPDQRLNRSTEAQIIKMTKGL
jgi:hypothetical protein